MFHSSAHRTGQRWWRLAFAVPPRTGLPELVLIEPLRPVD